MPSTVNGAPLSFINDCTNDRSLARSLEKPLISTLENGLDFVGLRLLILLRPICFSFFILIKWRASNVLCPRWSAHISCYHPLETLRNQFRTLATGFFWSLSWAVIAQNEILSPHSQMTYPDPIVWSSPFAAESMTGLFDIVRLQLGHVIWFSMFFPFLFILKIEINRQHNWWLRARQPD